MRQTAVPVYIEAKTKDELVKKFLEINAKLGTWHKFFDIQKDGKKWVAWFYQEAQMIDRIK